MKTEQLKILDARLFKDRVPIIHPNTLELEKEDFVEFQLKWLLKGVYSTTKTELKLLSYIYFYGVDAIQKVIDKGLFRSSKSVENYISKFRKEGIVIGVGADTKLHPGLKIIENRDITFIVKVNLKNLENLKELEDETMVQK